MGFVPNPTSEELQGAEEVLQNFLKIALCPGGNLLHLLTTARQVNKARPPFNLNQGALPTPALIFPDIPQAVG